MAEDSATGAAALPQQQQKLPKIYTLEDVNAITDTAQFRQELIKAIREGFQSYSNKEFNACPIQTMGAAPMAPFGGIRDDNYAAQTCVKSGYVTGASHYVIKVASGGHPLPSNSGLMQVYSQSTGRLEALLLDEGILTELRTAAAGALAASLLAPPSIRKIGMLGTGIQARYQLLFLQQVTSCRTVLLWGRTPYKMTLLKTELEQSGWNVELASAPNDLLEQCDLIVTTTCAREPILTLTEKRKKPQHITCIGADAPGKMELHPSLVAQSDLLVADCLMQTKERGEYQLALSQGLISSEAIQEIGSLVDQTMPDSHPGWTIFDSSGVAVQDCVIAKMTYDSLLAKETSS
eukprot:scaffold68080_cov51-Attheya_sp.AAC.6